MVSNYKEVYFDPYCSKCNYMKNTEQEEPCDECLNNPVNEYTHRPVKFEDNE